MGSRGSAAGWFGVVAVFLASAMASAQTQQNQTPSQKQDIPDAPSAVRPPQPLPPPAPVPAAPEPQPSTQPNEPSGAPEPVPGATGETPPPAPPFKMQTIPAGQAPAHGDGQEKLYKLVVQTNQVIVPVRVTDSSGQMIPGLSSKDFAVYEDNKRQTLNFFTSDPISLSAAVILDLGMPDATVQKVNKTFAALEGAFSQYDEVALYTYSSAVAKLADFGAVGKRLDATLQQLKYVTGTNNGPPEIDSPMTQGPVINGIPVDPSAPRVQVPPQESHVLNDAILQATVDLSRRDKARRRVIFVISDGRELHSTASYRNVLKVLLTNNVSVYAIGVGTAALPGYKSLGRLHLPRMGYTDILPRYTNATAGEYITDNTRDAIEGAYAKSMGEARNEYTLGYTTHGSYGESYHQIEVTVDMPDVKVYAKDGYYPAAPGH